MDASDERRWDPTKIAACVDECREHHGRHVKNMAEVRAIIDELKKTNFDTFGARANQLLLALDQQDERVAREFQAVNDEFGNLGRDATAIAVNATESVERLEMRRALT